MNGIADSVTEVMASDKNIYKTAIGKEQERRKKRNHVKGSVREELMKGKDKTDALPKLPGQMKGKTSAFVGKTNADYSQYMKKKKPMASRDGTRTKPMMSSSSGVLKA